MTLWQRIGPMVAFVFCLCAFVFALYYGSPGGALVALVGMGLNWPDRGRKHL